MEQRTSQLKPVPLSLKKHQLLKLYKNCNSREIKTFVNDIFKEEGRNIYTQYLKNRHIKAVFFEFGSPEGYQEVENL